MGFYTALHVTTSSSKLLTTLYISTQRVGEVYIDYAKKNYDQCVSASLHVGKAMAEASLTDIKGCFENLLMTVRSALEGHQVKVKTIRKFLSDLFQGDYDLPEDLDLSELFDCVTQAKLWSFDHYSALHDLCNSLLPEDDSSRKSVCEYISRLSAFLATNKVSNCSELFKMKKGAEWFSLKKYNRQYRILTVKLKPQTDISLLMLDYVDKLWQALRDELHLPSQTAVLDQLTESNGTLSITWLVLPHVARRIETTCFKSLKFFECRSIVKIWLCHCLHYDAAWLVSFIQFQHCY